MCGKCQSRVHTCKKFGIGQWPFIGPGSEKKWYSMEENSPQGIWDHIAEKMLLEFAESCCPILRATTPLSRCKLKSKGHEKLSLHFAADQETIETIFRIIVFANQLSFYGAVANMFEEFEESFHDRSGKPDVLMGQSIVLSEIKAEVPLENDIPSHQNLLLQRYEERIKLLSQENMLLRLDSISSLRRLKNRSFPELVVNTLFQEVTNHHNKKDGFRETKIGSVLEVTTSCLYGKHGIEIGIWSLRKDNSQSWVRIFHESKKFVIDSNDNNTEVLPDIPEEQASQLKVKDFACRSKGKRKTAKNGTC